MHALGEPMHCLSVGGMHMLGIEAGEVGRRASYSLICSGLVTLQEPALVSAEAPCLKAGGLNTGKTRSQTSRWSPHVSSPAPLGFLSLTLSQSPGPLLLLAVGSGS